MWRDCVEQYEPKCHVLGKRHGHNVAAASGMTSSVANAIAVSGGNVYVAGSASSSAGIGTAVLWVNGTATTLSPPSGMTGSVANAIVVSGGDVYAVGTAWSSDIEKWAAYWVNGAATLLPRPGGLTVDYYANGIVVSGGDVYVSGYTDFGNGGIGTAISWANGGWATTLSLPSGWLFEDYTANGITVSGSDVYVAGGGVNSMGNKAAAYWMNGTPTTLPMPGDMPNSSAGSYADGITISGSDVYTVGYAGQTAAYWVNDGEGTLLPMPAARISPGPTRSRCPLSSRRRAFSSFPEFRVSSRQWGSLGDARTPYRSLQPDLEDD